MHNVSGGNNNDFNEIVIVIILSRIAEMRMEFVNTCSKDELIERERESSTKKKI